jgi:hypothetical protein
MPVSPLGGGEGGDAMPMKTTLELLIILSSLVRCQSQPDVSPAWRDPVDLYGGPQCNSADSSPGIDSLFRRIALLAVAQAQEEVTATDFWHRLIPRVSVEGGIGMRDIAFPDAGGALLLPRDSYRLTLALSLSSLIGGSAHTCAELHLAETETRFLILLRRQFLARRALQRKKEELYSELAALRDELSVRGSAVACQELLFAQGRADFHALAGARIDLIRLKHSASRLEISVRELEETLAAEPSP